MSVSHLNDKGGCKQIDIIKKQHQPMEFSLNTNSQSKVLSADSMIENLLSKKEIFQKQNPPDTKAVTASLPVWLTSTPPPLYERVWHGVQSADGLANTSLLSPLLLTSGLPTDTLGYIWSLANRTVPGALTQLELYLALALVGLAQAGYVVNKVEAINQVPQAPLPTLDLSLLPTRQQVYPNTLSVTSLPDPVTFNWKSSDLGKLTSSGQIEVSYVGSEPMVSPNLKLGEIHNSLTTNNISENNINESLPIRKYPASGNPKCNVKLNSNTRRSDHTHCFSFPKLNDSPTHLVNSKLENEHSLDDEFTDFQSAPLSLKGDVVKNRLEDDEFTNFQTASSTNYIIDDLSVLVIGGKEIPPSHQLWVTDSTPVSMKNCDEISYINRNDVANRNTSLLNHSSLNRVEENKCNIKAENDSFHQVGVQNEKDKQIVRTVLAGLTSQEQPISTLQHSFFDNTETSLDILKSELQTENLHFSNLKLNPLNDSESGKGDEDNDEYSNFQNYPVTFLNSKNVSTDNSDKYDVFRTIVLEDSEFGKECFATPNKSEEERITQIEMFETGSEPTTKEDENNLFSDTLETKSLDSLNFGDSLNFNSLFPSSVLSEQNNETENIPDSLPELCLVEDKYKALRHLETPSNQADDFGEFLGVELPNLENESRISTHLCLTQIQCLESCLKLLKGGLSILSQASTPELESELLNDERANTYLNCLLEVHRVAERITSQLSSNCSLPVLAELQSTWDSLASYLKHTQLSPMADVVGTMCGVCKSNTGPSPVTLGAQTYHTPCANLYLHCVQPVLPNISSTLVQ